MAWRPHGRARVDAARPQAWATCNRCGFLGNLVDLQYQYQWAGVDKINLGIKVCDRCLDTPSEFLRTIILPPDPVPVDQPRPEAYAIDEVDYRVTEDRQIRVTETVEEPRVRQSTDDENAY